LGLRAFCGEGLREMTPDMSEMKKIPLLVCAQCSNLFYFEPGKPIYCPAHPDAKLKASEYPFLPRINEYLIMSIEVMFFEGCGVVGLSIPLGPKGMQGLSYLSPETYCKVSYDKEQGCWIWVENLPPERRTGLTVNLDPEEEEKYGVLIDRLVKCPYSDAPIWYRPSRRVGLVGYGSQNGIWGKRVTSCPFHTLDRINASFYPDGDIGLRFSDVPLSELGTKSEELYRRIIGEIFRIRYEVDKGWMWVNQRVQSLDDYIKERKKKEKEARKRAKERWEKYRKKKKEKEEAALEEGFKALFE
jgi:hypothetical protein